LKVMLKRLLVLLALVVVVVGLLLPGDSKASNNEIASSVNQTDSAIITPTTQTPPLPSIGKMMTSNRK